MKHLAIGLMSGTSADGISAALGEFDGHTVKFLGEVHDHYPIETRRKILNGSILSTKDLSELNMEIGTLFGKAANHLLRKLKIPSEKVYCIGSHGQTFYHGPNDKTPNSFQLGDAAAIAEKTGINVVSHFREKDLVLGGEGAPLVPYFDHYFFGRSATKALVNLGGIANLSIVGKSVNPPLAFDVGPGNCLMDAAVRELSDGQESFDRGGRYAKAGQMDLEKITKMIEEPYFKKSPPRSTGLELFNLDFIKRYMGPSLGPISDVLATLNYFTCITIQESFRSYVFNKFAVDEIILSGGGVYNKVMTKKLECLFAPIPVISIEKKGIPPLSKEPLAFAFFGLRCLQNKINHLPSCTGAKKAAVLGSITKA